MSTATSQSAAAKPRPKKKQLDPVERVGKLAAIFTAFLTLVPIPIVLLVSISSNWVQGPFAGVTFEWFARAWSRMDQAVFVSLQIMVIVLTIDLIVALPASWFITRYQFPGRSILRSMTSLPLAIPGIAIGLGLILSFPHLRESGWLLVAGHVLYTIPFLLGTLIPAMDSPRLKDQEVVASSLGMHPFRTFFTVTLPAIRRALFGGILMVVTLSLGEFNVSFFLFTPTAQPMPVFLFDSYLTGRIEQAAAQTIIFLAMVIIPAIFLEKFQKQQVGAA
ncbi:ABC transporter permease [Corynebacterium camporealensis]